MSKKDFIVARILLISIFIAIIIAIILIINVWRNFGDGISGDNDMQTTENLDIGTFKVESYDTDYAIQKYLEN